MSKEYTRQQILEGQYSPTVRPLDKDDLFHELRGAKVNEVFPVEGKTYILFTDGNWSGMEPGQFLILCLETKEAYRGQVPVRGLALKTCLEAGMGQTLKELATKVVEEDETAWEKLVQAHTPKPAGKAESCICGDRPAGSLHRVDCPAKPKEQTPKKMADMTREEAKQALSVIVDPGDPRKPGYFNPESEQYKNRVALLKPDGWDNPYVWEDNPKTTEEDARIGSGAEGLPKFGEPFHPGNPGVSFQTVNSWPQTTFIRPEPSNPERRTYIKTFKTEKDVPPPYSSYKSDETGDYDLQALLYKVELTPNEVGDVEFTGYYSTHLSLEDVSHFSTDFNWWAHKEVPIPLHKKDPTIRERVRKILQEDAQLLQRIEDQYKDRARPYAEIHQRLATLESRFERVIDALEKLVQDKKSPG